MSGVAVTYSRECLTKGDEIIKVMYCACTRKINFTLIMLNFVFNIYNSYPNIKKGPGYVWPV